MTTQEKKRLLELAKTIANVYSEANEMVSILENDMDNYNVLSISMNDINVFANRECSDVEAEQIASILAKKYEGELDEDLCDIVNVVLNDNGM